MGIFSWFSKKNEEKSEEEKVLIDLDQALNSLRTAQSCIGRLVLDGFLKTRDTHEITAPLSAANSWITEALNRLYVLEKKFKNEKGTYRNQNLLAQFNNALENLRTINQNIARSKKSFSSSTSLPGYGKYINHIVERLEGIKSNLESVFGSMK